MRLLIFVAVVIGIAIIFGAVYGISALRERKGSGSSARPATKTTAPDDDPEFLRNLARRLAEEEAKRNETGEADNDK
jgi:hypothetical protein